MANISPPDTSKFGHEVCLLIIHLSPSASRSLPVRAITDAPFFYSKAGLVLADALINKAQGERPVTLIGYSLGARLIYSCLMSLAERRAFGLVESAVLIGAPTPSGESPHSDFNTPQLEILRVAALATTVMRVLYVYLKTAIHLRDSFKSLQISRHNGLTPIWGKSDAAVWRAMRSVVSGRLVNVYSENDYILAFLYRTSSIQVSLFPD